ncbi:type VI secretion system Vgr family protein [Martelella alba]|uniref:Type VI secretion system tip protein VgrG n=1 Tax=Martelella alba TaxID=2590451 RepID=A0ABY2SJS3_9HYPH|nr:type VI secretion system tip protein TssI/VgrG [Martelella alba]TKI04342.1 type VI secretion system tip protein VgrG [Martelella alba]
MENKNSHRITINNNFDARFIFLRLEGSEELSALFHFTVECLSERPDHDLAAFPGQEMALEIQLESGGRRYLQGLVATAEYAGRHGCRERYHRYRFSIRPALWRLALNQDCRIWQGRTLPEIVTSLLNEHHIRYENTLTHDYRPCDYCVQYQESAFDFISRLMEHEGIYYYFRHAADGHVMVLCDAPENHRPVDGYENIRFQQPGFGLADLREGIQVWSATHAVTADLCILDDYDFRRPRARLLEAGPRPASPPARMAEIFHWPGGHHDNHHGRFLARIRQERLAANQQKITGLTTARGMSPGHTFSLADGPIPTAECGYLVLGMRYRLSDPRFCDEDADTRQTDNARAEFSADFEAMPCERPWRPARKTPWPKTQGPQTAEVTGPPGKTIWTDKYGRVKLKFRWDRHGSGDDTGACWVRVSSGWAGWKYGSIQVPRVGEEVIVDFINGDPDRPIITGRVYNEDAQPPWALPEHAARMGFMSRSGEGGPENASYLFLEDAAGREMFAMHAERDMRLSVENDYRGAIEGNLTQTIAGQSDYAHLGPCTILKAAPDRQTFRQGKTSVVTAGGRADIIHGGDYRQVAGDIERAASGTLNCHAGKTLSQRAGRDLMFDAGKRIIYGDHLAADDPQAQSGNTALRRYRTDNALGSGRGPRPTSLRPIRILYIRTRSVQVAGDAILRVARNMKQHIGGDARRTIKGESREHIGGDLTIRSDADVALQSGGETRLTADKLVCKIEGVAETRAATRLTVAGTSETVDGMAIAVAQTALHTRNLMMSNHVVDMTNAGMRMETVGVNIAQGQLDIRTTLLSLHTSALTIFI